MKRMAPGLLSLALLLGGMSQAKADLSLTGSVYESYNPGSGSGGTIGDPGGNLVATFSTSKVDYYSPDTVGNDYTIGYFLGSNATFLTGATHASDALYNTYIVLTGTATFIPGTQTVTFLHDDGAEVLLTNGSQTIDINEGGPTEAVQNPHVETFLPGTHTVTIAYYENTYAPAELYFSVTPEPATLTMAASGLIGLAGYQIRRRKRVVA